MTSGPFHTDHEALNASLDHQPGRARNTELPATALNLADLAAVLSTVELGAWDRRIVEWLADWEPSTIAVVCGLIRQARTAELPLTDVSTILATLDEAVDHKRDRAANCPDCTDQSCDNCEYWLQTVEATTASPQARRAAPAWPSTQAAVPHRTPATSQAPAPQQPREREGGA